jgi:hypothetical protein
MYIFEVIFPAVTVQFSGMWHCLVWWIVIMLDLTSLPRCAYSWTLFCIHCWLTDPITSSLSPLRPSFSRFLADLPAANGMKARVLWLVTDCYIISRKFRDCFQYIVNCRLSGIQASRILMQPSTVSKIVYHFLKVYFKNKVAMHICSSTMH